MKTFIHLFLFFHESIWEESYTSLGTVKLLHIYFTTIKIHVWRVVSVVSSGGWGVGEFERGAFIHASSWVLPPSSGCCCGSLSSFLYFFLCHRHGNRVNIFIIWSLAKVNERILWIFYRFSGIDYLCPRGYPNRKVFHLCFSASSFYF